MPKDKCALYPSCLIYFRKLRNPLCLSLSLTSEKWIDDIYDTTIWGTRFLRFIIYSKLLFTMMP